MSEVPEPPPYPPEPWLLGGTGATTTWRVAADRVPALPAGVRPATVRGRALVLTAFVDHGGDGVPTTMSYRELLAAVVVRHGRGVALSITHIYVDSEAPLRGGRELWGIPKLRADLRGLTAIDQRGPIAFATNLSPHRLPAPALPLPPLSSSVVQTRGEQVVATPVRMSGRVRAARADWTFPSANALGWLRGARPVASVRVERFALRFGS